MTAHSVVQSYTRTLLSEAWWRRGNTFASHRYGPGHMWDVFHHSQPMPGSFPLAVSSTLRRGQNCFVWPELVLDDVKSAALPLTILLCSYTPQTMVDKSKLIFPN